MDWLGVNRKVYPVWRDGALAIYQQNLRMRVHGELQRRNGMASSNVAKQATPIYNLIPVADPSGPGIIIVPQGGTVVVQPGSPIPKWIHVRPIIPIGSSCTLMQPFTDTGPGSISTSMNPPPGVCTGTITCTGVEGGSGQGYIPYGYLFVVVTYNGATITNTYSSACLINQGQSFALPLGTTMVQYNVTGGCNGGFTQGTWTLGITTP
jgi:hypothetical protein